MCFLLTILGRSPLRGQLQLWRFFHLTFHLLKTEIHRRDTALINSVTDLLRIELHHTFLDGESHSAAVQHLVDLGWVIARLGQVDLEEISGPQGVTGGDY